MIEIRLKHVESLWLLGEGCIWKYGSVYFVSGSRRRRNPKAQRATFFRIFFQFYRTFTQFSQSGCSLSFGVMVIRGCLCWMSKFPIGRDDTMVSRIWVLYRDWLYRRKISKKFWMAKMGGGCWRYRGPIVMDDTREGLVWAWYRSWLYRRQIGSRKWVKNRVKSWILLVWDAQQTVLAENQHGSMILYIVSESKLRNMGLCSEKFILKDFAGQIFDQFFPIFSIFFHMFSPLSLIWSQR